MKFKDPELDSPSLAFLGETNRGFFMVIHGKLGLEIK
jgi:hypothetical protein